MEPKLFILNTRFLNLREKRGTFDVPFTKDNGSEMLCIRLMAEELSKIIGNDRFVIISNMALSSIHAAEIINPHVSKSSKLGQLVLDAQKVKPQTDELVCWNDYLKKEEEARDPETFFVKSREHIARTLALGMHVIFLPKPETVLGLLSWLNVPGTETSILNVNRIGGEFVFIFDKQVRYLEKIDLSLYIINEKARDEKIAELFINEAAFEASLILQSLQGYNLINNKLEFLRRAGYDTSKLSAEYKDFLEIAL